MLRDITRCLLIDIGIDSDDPKLTMGKILEALGNGFAVHVMEAIFHQLLLARIVQ